MNGLRKVVGFLMVLMLAAFALPASADKQFTQKMEGAISAGLTSTPLPGTFATVTATIVNLDTGNSTFNSVKVMLRPPDSVGKLNIVSWVSTTPSSGVPFVDPAGDYIQITGMSPVKKGKSVVLVFKVSDTGDSCADRKVEWDASAWTGSIGSPSTDFSNQTSATSADRQSTITGNCTLVFSTQPADALSNGLLGSAANPVTVQGSPASQFNGKSITLSIASGAGGTLNNARSAVSIDSNGFAKFPDITLTSAGGNYQLGATTGPTGFPTATSEEFTIGASAGVLACGGTLGGSFTNPNGLPDTAPGWAAGVRGVNSTKGPCSTAVNYNVDNKILDTGKTISLVWDALADPNAVYSLAANGPAEDVNAAQGWPNILRPKTSWLKNSSGADVFIDSLSCVAPIAAKTYAALGSSVNSGSSAITVNLTPTAPATYATTPLPPFVIKLDSERLTVNAVSVSVSGTTWTLASLTQSAHTAGTLVVSEFPLLPEPYGSNIYTVPGSGPAVAGMVAGTGTITIRIDRTRDLPPVPFPIVIGTERLYVVVVSNVTATQATLTADRADGLTVGGAHAVADYVMSTPLPLIPPVSGSHPVPTPYVAGSPALMCVWDFGFTSIGIKDDATDTLQIMRRVKWIDSGDSKMQF